MSGTFKIILKIIGVALGLILILWMGVAAYVTANKKELLETITTQLNEDITGKLTIGSMQPDLIRGFPGISVSLNNVSLQDSLYEKHGHKLLEAKEAYVALNILSLLSSTPQIQKLSIKDGKIYLYTDSLGNSNTSVFRKKDKSEKTGGNKGKRINKVEFINVSLVQENLSRNKLFSFNINSFLGKINYNRKGWKGNVKIDVQVNDLAFNTKRGSFLKDKPFVADLDLVYNSNSDILEIPLQNISIDNALFKIGGNFTSTEKSSDFKLQIIAPEIEFKKAVSLLAPNISSKMAIYDLKKPFFVEAIIQGSLKQKGNPKINVNWQVDENTLTVSGETINNCSFTGYLNNDYKTGAGLSDPNSVIGFENLKGTYSGIPFEADTIKIINLKTPIFEGRFKSAFALSKLNAISGGETINFDKGSANLNIYYRAPYNRTNDIQPFIYGQFKISNAGLTYQPRNLSFKNISGIVNFKGKDLLLQNLKVKSGSSSFVMQGSMANFMNLYYTDPKRIVLNWDIKSPQINLGEFLSFLGKRKAVTRKAKSSGRVFGQLEKVLDQASVYFNLQADKLVYRRFIATNVHSQIILNQRGIDLQDISLNNADGRLKIKGNIDQTGPVNRFDVSASIVNVNLTKLFYSFENFGQDAIAYQNLRGAFNSATKISGSMRDNGQIIPKSLAGTVSFDIKNGSLVNFEPVENVGKFAFPNRDFSNITFTSLKNTLDINGSTITIRPMVIASSVINLSVEGVYGMPAGTDIALRVPIRNPKRDAGLSDSLKAERFDRGIVLNLRAKSDEYGAVKIKLGKKEEEKSEIEDQGLTRKEERVKERTLKREEKAIEKLNN